MNFELEKQNALNKNDKSHEQKIDDKIISLCNKINSSPNFFTTSSCSGRITIVRTKDKKEPNTFLFKSHKPITTNQIKNTIKNHAETIYFRMEPAALHVAAKTLNDAITLLTKARNVGFKKSGIIPGKDKFMIEMFSTEIIAAPLNKDTPDDYLELLVTEANEKLKRTNDKIERLEEVIS